MKVDLLAWPSDLRSGSKINMSVDLLTWPSDLITASSNCPKMSVFIANLNVSYIHSTRIKVNKAIVVMLY